MKYINIKISVQLMEPSLFGAHKSLQNNFLIYSGQNGTYIFYLLRQIYSKEM